MNRCEFKKEPVDMRLMVLRFLKKLWIAAAVAVAGTLLTGGIYFGLKLVGPLRRYQAQSMYFIEFATDPRLNDAYSYYNDYTWNVWISSDEFVSRIQAELTTEMTDEELRTYLFADLPADLRMPVTIITTPDRDLTMEVVRAVEKTLLKLPEFQKEVEKVRVVDSPEEAVLVTGKNEFVRFSVLSFLSFFLVSAFLLWGFLLWDPSVFLPSTFERRYRIPMLGTLKSPDLKTNFEYLFEGREKIAFTAVSGETDLTEAKEAFLSAAGQENADKEITCVPALLQCPEAAETMRQSDGVLLLVEAGQRNAKRIEYILELMAKQEISVTAALLWNADEKLIRRYYFGSKKEN